MTDDTAPTQMGGSARIVAEPPPNVPAHVGDRYALQEPVGRGGMGEVWRAIDLISGAVVAVKFVRDGGPRFEREQRLGVVLADVHVVRVIESGTARDGRGYLVMEYYPAGTLQKLAGRFAQPQAAARLVAGLGRAAHAFHERGVIHRDIKPANVLFRAEDDPESYAIADFGVARSMGEEMTPPAQMAGTLAYASPEQLRDAAKADAKSDVYSLGAILCYLLTGEPPADRDPLASTQMRDAISRPTGSLPPNLRHTLERRGVPARLADACCRCLHADPRHRFPTAAALADELDCCLSTGAAP